MLLGVDQLLTDRGTDAPAAVIQQLILGGVRGVLPA
jgi:hypothetical protein